VLPQIDKDELENYLEYLESYNIPFEIDFQPVASLNSTQSEVDTEKVKSIMKDDESFNTPIIVSKDDYILDGHHRALAAFNTDKEAEVPVKS
jgi:ParB-like chromosome segregation protein Spo0J